MRGAPCRPVLKTLLLSPLSLTPQVVGRGKHATSRKARCSHCYPRTPRPATSSRMDEQLSSECQGANCDSSTDDTKRGLMRRALLATYEAHLREGCRDTRVVDTPCSTHARFDLIKSGPEQTHQQERSERAGQERRRSLRFDARSWDSGHPGCSPRDLLDPGQPKVVWYQALTG